MSARTHRLVTIDALRGVAALAVVMHHVPHSQGADDFWSFIALLPLDFGPLGVTLFLAISGFCIHLAARRTTSVRTGRTDWVAFWKRRIVRLYPPYVAAIAFSLALYYAADGAHFLIVQNRILNLPVDLGVHLFMVHNLLADYTYSLANGPLWSLGLEEQLYGLYAVYIALRVRSPAVIVALVTLAIALVWRLGIVVPFLAVRVGPLGAWWTWPFGWWWSWVVGAVVAEVSERTASVPTWCKSLRLAAVLALIGAVIYPNVVDHPYLSSFFAATPARQLATRALSQFSEPMFSMAFGIIMLRALEWERSRVELPSAVVRMSKLGGFSYSLYLTHLPVVFALWFHVPWLNGNAPPTLFLRYVVLVPTSIIVAYAFYWLVERWFIDMARKPSRALTADA